MNADMLTHNTWYYPDEEVKRLSEPVQNLDKKTIKIHEWNAIVKYPEMQRSRKLESLCKNKEAEKCSQSW